MKTDSAQKPKQHHYVPQAYLRPFTSDDGTLALYDLWSEGKLVRTNPRNVLKEKNLYTQPVHAERRFDTSYETLFSKVEGHWPDLMAKIEKRVILSEEERSNLYEFVVLMRVRVTNTLKAVSRLLQEVVEEGVDELDEPLPQDILEQFRRVDPTLAPRPGRKNILTSDLVRAGLISVSVDPHRALAALPRLVLETLPIFGRPGLLAFVHNRTQVDFITSDNPCIYFHRSAKDVIVPFAAGPEGAFEFYFPLGPRLAVRFATFARRHAEHRYEYSSGVVNELNLLTAKFADRYLIARSEIDPAVVGAFPDVTCVPDLARSVAFRTGEVHSIGYRWGPPIRTLPKWDYGFL